VRHREARDLASDAARADESNRRHEQEYAMDVNRSPAGRFLGLSGVRRVNVRFEKPTFSLKAPRSNGSARDPPGPRREPFGALNRSRRARCGQETGVAKG
jgi:hypothetical protein